VALGNKGIKAELMRTTKNESVGRGFEPRPPHFRAYFSSLSLLDHRPFMPTGRSSKRGYLRVYLSAGQVAVLRHADVTVTAVFDGANSGGKTFVDEGANGLPETVRSRVAPR
jgi:hypothetical protein